MATKRPRRKAAGDPQASDHAPENAEPPPLWCGRLCMRTHEGRIYRDGAPLELAPKEFVLLAMFMKHSGEVLPRSFLIREIWDTDYLGDTRMLDVHIRWLRRKIEDEPSAPIYLRTVRGVGYRFEAPVGDSPPAV